MESEPTFGPGTGVVSLHQGIAACRSESEHRIGPSGPGPGAGDRFGLSWKTWKIAWCSPRCRPGSTRPMSSTAHRSARPWGSPAGSRLSCRVGQPADHGLQPATASGSLRGQQHPVWRHPWKWRQRDHRHRRRLRQPRIRQQHRSQLSDQRSGRVRRVLQPPQSDLHQGQPGGRNQPFAGYGSDGPGNYELGG